MSSSSETMAALQSALLNSGGKAQPVPRNGLRAGASGRRENSMFFQFLVLVNFLSFGQPPILTFGDPDLILPPGCEVGSFIRAAALLPMNTVVEPFNI